MRILELLGITTFNIIAATTLAATFLGDAETKPAAITALTKENVSALVADMANIAAGRGGGRSDYDLINFMMDHLTENSLYQATINYDLDEKDDNKQETLEMQRMDYISHVMKEQKALDDRESVVNVEYVEIAKDGKSLY